MPHSLWRICEQGRRTMCVFGWMSMKHVIHLHYFNITCSRWSLHFWSSSRAWVHKGWVHSHCKIKGFPCFLHLDDAIFTLIDQSLCESNPDLFTILLGISHFAFVILIFEALHTINLLGMHHFQLSFW